MTHQEWASSTKVARAFSVGHLESKAIVNLVTKIREDVVQALTEAVRRRGMPKLITHEACACHDILCLCVGSRLSVGMLHALTDCPEAIAKEVFNIGWSSGTGNASAWEQQLTNLNSTGALATSLASP